MCIASAGRLGRAIPTYMTATRRAGPRRRNVRLQFGNSNLDARERGERSGVPDHVTYRLAARGGIPILQESHRMDARWQSTVK
jgi:hypothetical protein